MWQENPACTEPDADAKIWRYMDFTKFVSMLDSGNLQFSRADKLEDPFEGSFPKINTGVAQPLPTGFSEDAREGYNKCIVEKREKMKAYTAINCWHRNDHESLAMWKLYLKSDEGIAISSTWRKLKTSIIDNEAVIGGEVNYIDYESYSKLDPDSIFSQFFCKRISFSYEQEIRLIVSKSVEFLVDNTAAPIPAEGLKIKVALHDLIESIYVAPKTPEWIQRLVENVTKKYTYGFPIINSKIDDTPLF